MRITESRLRQIIQEVMTEGNFEQAYAEELQSAEELESLIKHYETAVHNALIGLLGAYLNRHGGDEMAAGNAVRDYVNTILGS